MDNQEFQKSDICKLYKQLSAEKIIDIKQTEEELKLFKDMYARELLTNRDSVKTASIITDLEGIIENEKAEYHRLKAISVGNKQPRD